MIFLMSDLYSFRLNSFDIPVYTYNMNIININTKIFE